MFEIAQSHLQGWIDQNYTISKITKASKETKTAFEKVKKLS